MVSIFTGSVRSTRSQRQFRGQVCSQKTRADFDGPTFREMFVKSHQECGIEIEETTCFKEPNENGLFHLNLLVRGLDNICESVNLVLRVPTAVQLVQQAPDTSFAEANQRMRAEAIISMQNGR